MDWGLIERTLERSFGDSGRNGAVRTYVDPHAERYRIAAQLQDQGLEVCRDWHEFRLSCTEPVEVMICAIPELGGTVWRDLLAIRAKNAALACIMITEHTEQNTYELASNQIDEVLFLHQISKDLLHAAIRGLARRTTLRLAAAKLRENNFGLDPEFAETLAKACVATYLVRTVNELARMTGLSRSQFTRRWKQCIPHARPHRFLDWLLLMHATQVQSRTGLGWTKVAEALGVDADTLTGACRRAFDATPGQLKRLDRSRLLGALWEIVDQSFTAAPTCKHAAKLGNPRHFGG
jgi:hypothetical protein